MKKIGMALLAGLVALAIFISPMVFSAPSNAYAIGKLTLNSAPSYTPLNHHGGKGRGRGHGRVNTGEILTVLSKWSGISTETLNSVIKEYNLNIPRLINATVLSKAANISINEAANIVANGNLNTYIEENNLREAFMQTRRELAQYMKGFRDGCQQCGSHSRRGSVDKGRIWSDFINVLAGWSGIPTETIVSIQKDFRLNPARTINAVVLAKVGNIDLQTSASIVAAGNLQSYLEEQGLTEAFQTARQEVMQLLKQEAQNIKEKLEEKIADALARWSGFDKDEILGLIEEKNIGYATTVVILGKVAGISLDEAKQIVDNGKLMSYLKEHNLFEKFKKAKIEIMKLLARIRKP